MSRDPDAALPPYFSISPDAALAELGSPVGTQDFAAIAEAAGGEVGAASGRAPTLRAAASACGCSRPGRSPAT